MLGNYIILAWRNLKKHKIFSLINLSGLTIGMACCLLLALYIHSELSIDAYHEKADRIFRVGENVHFSNFRGKSSSTNGVIAEALKKDYPEVEETARFYRLPAVTSYATKQFAERFLYADPAVFKIFSWPLRRGDPAIALAAPYSIVLTESTARKYFGPEDPSGKILTLNGRDSYRVTGVMRDIPPNSTFQFAGLASFGTLYGQSESLTRLLTDWGSHNFETYLLLAPGAGRVVLENKIKDIYFRYHGKELKAKGASYEVFLQPLRDIYLRPLRQDFGPLMYVYIFSAVAVFILLIACANFMNLSTARSLNRATEVGLRKVLGAGRRGLIMQFLTEAMGLTILSMIAALGIAFLFLPEISLRAGWDLRAGLLDNPWLIPAIIGITLITGLAAGSYPAFFLSRFQPVRAIRSLKRNNHFRRGLVLVQFTISATLIMGTWLIIQQLDYLKSKDPGFNKDHVLYLPAGDPQIRQSLPVLKEKIVELPGVAGAGAASTLPGWGAPTNDKIPQGYTKENMQLMLELNVDEDFLATMGIELIAGRNFSKEFGNDPRGSVIINETAARRYGWKQPLGKAIKTLNIDKPLASEWEERTVIGVVKDYHIQDLTRPIEPAFIGNVLDHPFSYGQMKVLAVRIEPGSSQAVVSSLEKVWKDLFPDKPFSSYFMDEDFNGQFLRIEQSRDVFSYFTGIATFIACLGLFGMASFTVEKRVKEIGIRKTLGSSVLEIVKLLSREIFWLVLAANLIACPVAWYLISRWLADFPYKISIGAHTFVVSVFLSILISFATTAFQSVRAARANPVDALRNQ